MHERRTDPEPSTLAPLLAGRRSASVFDPGYELTDAQLDLLLEAARWAPSAGNSQPWSFVVARRGDRMHQRFVPLLSRGNSGWVPRASAVLVGLAQVRSEPGSEMAYSDYAEYDLGQAAADLTVQAEWMGLRVHQFAGFDHEAFVAEFAVPDHLKVMAGIAVGRWWPLDERVDVDESTAAREDRPRRRREIDDLRHRG